MSCIAGIVNLDGQPVDSSVLGAMINTMTARAPDGVGQWCSNHVGFAHALLRTDARAPLEKQPCTLEGRVWITADARIDGQETLRATLKSHGRAITPATTDTELILHAYAVFGKQLLDHLIGDFAFTIWDKDQFTLFCASDHFGIRPLYYAQINETLLFASEVDALLMHPLVSRDLNETAVGDFLLFGGYLEAEMTIYKDIHRLPGASTICLSKQSQPRVSTYWKLEEPPLLARMSTEDYINQFKHLFEKAVLDRVRSDNVALEMSGGMDSTSIAAVAKAHAESGTKLTAYTNTAYPLLTEDKEAYYAEQVASFLNIHIRFGDLSSSRLFDRSGSKELATSQPYPAENFAFCYEVLKSVTDNGARIITSGFMADSLFANHGSYYTRLLKNRELYRIGSDLISHIRLHKTCRGTGLRTLFKTRGNSNPVLGPLPKWLNLDFVAREDLSERWQWHWECYSRDRTIDQLRRPWLIHHFRGYEVFKLPLVSRFPFMDLRVVKFLSAAPNYIKHNKLVLRRAMADLLPNDVLTRPKEGVPGDILRIKLSRGMYEHPPTSLCILSKTDYVDPEAYLVAFQCFLKGDGQESTFWSSFILLPLALELWLSQNPTTGG